MNAVIIELSRVIVELSKEINDYEREVSSLRGDLNKARDELSELKCDVTERDSMLNRIAVLEEVARVLRTNSPDLKQAASDYMKETGQFLTYKIDAIKGVRKITNWGLMESKDFVGAWISDGS